MKSEAVMRHGGKILIDQLRAEGIARVFSVPGESFLAALDALHDAGIDNIVCRHEGAAAMMAEATGKLTGRPGIAFVTRGPGATNASSGVHVAMQDQTPMILFVGQIARGHRDREAFQEVDFRAMFAPLAKWAAEIDDTARISEYVSRAFHIATSGRPGPVVLALPEDMLSATADVPALPAMAARPCAVAAETMSRLREAISSAERPLIVAGGSVWSQQASDDLGRFAAASSLPVAVTFRRQDHIDNDHPNYIGDLGVGMNPKLGTRMAEADLLLLLGTRFGDTATRGYKLRDPSEPGCRVIHVHPDPDLPGQVWRPDLAITADVRAVVAALAAAPLSPRPGWAEAVTTSRCEYETWQNPVTTPGAVRMEEVVGWLSENLPPDAILTNGAGNYAAFLHRYFRWHRYGTQVAPTSGSMGYGFPAAIAAKLHDPSRTVICLAGDGCFQMTLNELSTAAQHGAAVIVIVANNGQYGTIRMHQERHYPGRVSGTALANPDFAALARAYGGHGETVETQADFPAAFARAAASGVVSVIELRLDPEALSTGMTLTQTRSAGEAAVRASHRL